MIRYNFYQYPRGKNNGGLIGIDLCPTITSCSWQYNFFLIKEYD